MQFVMNLFITNIIKFEMTEQSNTYIFTSHEFSWLQNGQLNCWSNGSIAFLLGGGFLLDFLLPIFYRSLKQIKTVCIYNLLLLYKLENVMNNFRNGAFIYLGLMGRYVYLRPIQLYMILIAGRC